MTSAVPGPPAAPPTTPPPFDPDLERVLAALAAVVPPALTPERIPAVRRGTLQGRPSDAELARNGRFTVADRSVPGPPGAPDVSLLICRPAGATAPVPAVYFVHGGGMVMGDNRSGVMEALDWADALELAVVSVEYRLAPENPHPAPVQDCWAGLLWTVEHATELGIDPARVIVAGQSAGGGLAAALALLARDHDGPALAGQLLMCPMLDDRNNSPSAVQMVGQGVWDRTANDTGWTALLGASRGGPDVSPYAAPARATDLSGLPPAFIDVGSAETFRDEDVAHAGRIWQAGGRAELHVWPGGFHSFDTFAPAAGISRDAKAARVTWLRRLLGS